MRKILSILLALALLLTATCALADMAPGTYEAEATGNNGPVKVAVTVDTNKIVSVEVDLQRHPGADRPHHVLHL